MKRRPRWWVMVEEAHADGKKSGHRCLSPASDRRARGDEGPVLRSTRVQARRAHASGHHRRTGRHRDPPIAPRPLKTGYQLQPTRVALSAAVLLLVPVSAWADPGLPMLVLVWPASALLLLPIIAVEAMYGQWIGFTPGLAWKVSSKANVFSTVFGIPLAWVGMLLLQLAVTSPLVDRNVPLAVWYVLSPTIGAAWLPGEGIPSWYLPLASAVLCVPFYFVAVPIEAWVARGMLPPDLVAQAKVWSRGANRLTYGMLIGGLLLVALVLGVAGGRFGGG